MSASSTNWWDLNESGVGPAFNRTGGFHADFSNFVPSLINIDGQDYRTVEHYFQAMKTLDPVEREIIREQKTPGGAKVQGRKATLRPDWDDVKVDVMTTALRIKFHLPRFRPSLENFEGSIVEWNTWHDRIWGVCTCNKCGRSGLNLLGQCLESVRDELRQRRFS